MLCFGKTFVHGVGARFSLRPHGMMISVSDARKGFSVPESHNPELTDVEERLKRSIDAFIRAKIDQGYSRDEIIKMGRKIRLQFFKVID